MPSNQQDAPPSELREELDARFHGPLMSFFMRRLKNRADAEDLTQETLLRMVRSGALEHIEHADSYVFKTAMNLLRDHKRLSMRLHPAACVPIDAALAGELERQLVEDLSPEKVLLSSDSLQEIVNILEELGERTRDIFVLFRLENMKQKEIAALYGIGQSTVEKHVMKAMLHLAARLGRKGSL